MILNLTQHVATPDQVSAGVVEPNETTKARIRALLGFEDIPSAADIGVRAEELAQIAASYMANDAMIGGALWLMASLERELAAIGVGAKYAFSKRVVIETSNEAGAVTKTAVFRHVGFVPAV